MRQDQYEKLQSLSEKLADVFLSEADPDTWPGNGKQPGEVDQQTRGDRYWCKKNAVSTLSLICRIANLKGTIQQQSCSGTGAGSVTDTENELDEEVKAAEKEAKRLLDELQRRSNKAEFDKRVHGKSA